MENNNSKGKPKKKTKINPNSLANLRPPWKEGEAPNPDGRPKGSRNKRKILEELMNLVINEEGIDGKVGEMSVLEMLHIKMIEQVKKHGNVAAYKALLDRYEGAVAPAENDGDETQLINFVSKESGPKLYEDESEIPQ